MARFIVVQSHHTDKYFDWYIIDTKTKACINMLSCGLAQATDVADSLNREAN